MVWGVRLYSKPIDHLKLASNITFITSNKQYNPNKSILDKDTKTNKTHIETAKKPIVLLYGWLMSQDKFLRKFSDIYNDHGFDVLRVKVKVGEVLWPRSVKSTIRLLQDFIFSKPDHPFLVHGFSVGGFVHTELLYSLSKCSEKERSEQAMGQIKGQIFDSVVDMYGVAEGVSKALYINDPFRQAFIRLVIQSYLNFTRKQVYEEYIRDSKIFHSNRLNVPSLMFYSQADTIGAAGPIEAAIDKWRSNGVPVIQKCWEDSHHVEHFKAYPEEYTSLLNSFLATLGFIQTPGVRLKEEESSKMPCDGGLKDTDANSPLRFKTVMKNSDGVDGKPIEVMREVGEKEVEKRVGEEEVRRKKLAAVNKIS